MHVKAIVFDVHRTLVDDSGFPRERIIRLLTEAGVEVDADEYYALYDRLTRDLFDWPHIQPFISIREIHRRRLRRFYQYYHVNRDVEADLDYLWQEMGTGRIYPDAVQILSRLTDRYKLGLLSNADDDDPLIQILLQAGYVFDAVVTSEEVGVYKPHSAMFARMLQNLNMEPYHVLMVGDSPVSDVMGARQAGITIAWINRKQIALPPDLPKPDFEVSSLTELIPILEVGEVH